jgi:transcriptional regulator with XRE-family HTH domain
MSSVPQSASPPTLAQEFGRFVRETREAKGLSMNEFCRRVGLSGGYESQMERGLVALPGEASIVKMAEVLEVNADLLLSKAGKVRRDVMKYLWSSPLIPGVLSQATGLPPDAALQIAKNVAEFLESKP